MPPEPAAIPPPVLMALLEGASYVLTVRSATIVTDKFNGRRTRFGYVEMASNAEAALAIARLNMTQYEDTVMSVSRAWADR